jgi:hypothetical protein
MKTTWYIIKTETYKNHTNKGTQLINIDGKLITNQQSIANFFNNYFLTAADKITSNFKNDKTSLNCNNPIHCLYKNFKVPCSNMKLKYTTLKEIEKIIKSLKSKNSHKYDGIPMKILKVSTPFITSPPTYIPHVLLYIHNISHLSDIFSSQLKFSEIKPLRKKEDRKDITNFRPTSLFTSFSRILEKVIYTKLYQRINQHNILATK